MGSFRHLISSIGYFVGTFLLLPSTSLLLPFGDYKAGILLLVCACAYLTVAAVIDFVDFGFLCAKTTFSEKLASLFMLLGGILFLTASILYLPDIGKCQGMNAADLGTEVFRIGSVSYLLGSFTCLYSLFSETTLLPSSSLEQSCGTERLLSSNSYGELTVKKSSEYICPEKLNWLVVILSYVTGALLYITGGVLSQLKFAVEGVITWIIGSTFFFCGAFVQLYEVVRTWDK